MTEGGNNIRLKYAGWEIFTGDAPSRLFLDKGEVWDGAVQIRA